MVKEVADSYTQLRDLGFKAFERSRAYAAAQREITDMAAESSGYLYVDYQSRVRVHDLLGHPSGTVMAEAKRVLQTLVPPVSQQQCTPQPRGYTQQFKVCWARHTPIAVGAILLYGLAHYLASMLKGFVAQ